MAPFLTHITASQPLLLMFATSQPLPHPKFVYSSDTCIFPAKRDKSVSLLWLGIAIAHHLLPPAQLRLLEWQAAQTAQLQHQFGFPRLRLFFFLMGEGRMVCKTALWENLVSISSQPTFLSLQILCIQPHSSDVS